MAKKKQQLWFGYLEAGQRSSAVVRDGSIDTGRASTIYLYNLAKGKILEYQRDIVEPKLRELGKDDISRDELDKAFRDARKKFSSTHKSQAWADSPPVVIARKSEDDDMSDIDLDDDDDTEDFIDDDD